MMDVIVDGYNVIGSDRGLTGALEHKRSRLIQQLSRYQQLKGFKVSVIFDGWRSGAIHEVAQVSGGVTVIYSRQGEKADSVVVRLARASGSGCVVVSSDREIRNAVEKFGAVAISAGQFAGILQQLERPQAGDSYFEDGEFETRAAAKGNPRRLGKLEKKRVEMLRKLRP